MAPSQASLPDGSMESFRSDSRISSHGLSTPSEPDLLLGYIAKLNKNKRTEFIITEILRSAHEGPIPYGFWEKVSPEIRKLVQLNSLISKCHFERS
jgi:hypothetical protein